MPRKIKPSSKSPTRDIAESWARERPDLRPVDYLLPIYILRIGRILERRDDRQCLARFGVSGSDMRVLFALRRAGEPYARRPTDLFRALLVTSGAITKQVDRLEAAGLVERAPDPDNTGGFLVKLTATGLDRADAAVSAVAQTAVTTPLFTALSEAESTALLKICAKVLLGYEAEDVAAGPDV